MWLISAATQQAIEDAARAGMVPTAEQQAEYAANNTHAVGEPSKLLTTAGNIAKVQINGVLTKTPSFFMSLFGGGNATYTDIINAVTQAENDPEVEAIELHIDSPGGAVDGLFDAVDAIRATEKPVKTIVSGQAASAAYALASAADSIEATSKASRFGSIGVVRTYYVSDREVDITSTNAPRKRPDVTTEEGAAAAREELDAVHDLFVEAIAEGRGVTAEKINAEYGQGGTFLAGEALKRGMIDAMPTPAKTKPRSRGKQPEATTMDLKTLQAQHPDVYASAVQEGVTQERDRVSAHLIMGEAAGALDTAITAVKDGSEMTATLSATYTAAGMNKNAIEARQADEDSAAAADNAAAADEGEQAGDVAAIVENLMGIGE